jgi:hypothetical protein
MFDSEQNPFEVLRLDPAASDEEIVRRAARLRRRAGDESAVAELRRAVQSLTGRPEERQLFALLTHPRPGYAAPALVRLAAEFRRPPAAQGQAPPCPALDLGDFAKWIASGLAAELESPAVEFEPLVAQDEADEIRRQNAEARWLSLIYDPAL